MPRAGAVALSMFVVLAFAGRARADRVVTDLELRGAYLYNFARFSEWPTPAFRSSNAPFEFAILGDSAVAGSLRRALENKRIGTHAIAVIDARTAADCATAQIVYLGAAESRAVGEALAALKGRPVLTVSEVPSFLRMGGMIRFVRQEQTLGFEVNQRAATGAGVRLSPRLLQLARSVVGAGS